MKTRYAVDEDERRTRAISFKMKPTHFDLLKKLSKDEGRTITYIMEKAIERYFKEVKVR
jgi:predicted DNA-binding protein